jgi:hypothetical protein
MAYTNIDDPSVYFQAVTYTGDGIEPRNIDVGFQADFIWVKDRTSAKHHRVFDSSRGNVGPLYANMNVVEDNYNDGPEIDFSSPYSNGFKIIDNPDGVTGSLGVNSNANLMISWNWKANGGTTVSNTDGSITSTVQANTDAGFSIVTYGGTGSAATAGHGLSDTPDVIIFKNRDDANVWAIYHQGIGNNEKLVLDSNAGEDADGAFMNGTLPTSSVFSLGASVNTNGSSDNYVAYCFTEKQGYSQFGKYVGNGIADGPFVYTGFKPAFLIMKRTDSTGNWVMFDTKRDTYNVTKHRLFPNLTNTDNTTRNYIDLLSNGFKLRDPDVDHNANAAQVVYMAFAENPFTTSTGIPTTAR